MERHIKNFLPYICFFNFNPQISIKVLEKIFSMKINTPFQKELKSLERRYREGYSSIL